MRKWITLFFLSITFPFSIPAYSDTEADAVDLLIDRTEQLYQQGDLNLALETAKRALATAEEASGPDDSNVIVPLWYVGRCHLFLEMYPEAEEAHKRALSISERRFGPDHIMVAYSLNGLSTTYAMTGRIAESKPLVERALAIGEEVLGANHTHVAISLSILANLHLRQQDHGTARRLTERALAIRETSYGPDHPEVADDLSVLANLDVLRRDYVAARRRIERALAIREASYGLRSPKVADSLSDLAFTYTREEDFKSAIPLFERALAIYRMVFGPKDRRVIWARSHLAHMGRMTEGDHEDKRLRERDTETEENSLGIIRPRWQDRLLPRATRFWLAGESSEVLSLMRDSLKATEEAYGPGHIHTASDLYTIGTFRITTGDYSEAESALKRALAIRERRFGAEHPLVAETMAALAGLYLETGKHSDAGLLYARCLSIYEGASESNDPGTASVLYKMAYQYGLYGDYPKAEFLLIRSLAIREEIFGPDHLSVVQSLLGLASLYQGLGDRGKAEPILERSLGVYESLHAPGRNTEGSVPDIDDIIGTIGRLYYRLGDYRKARQLLQRSLTVKERVFGSEHTEVAKELRALAAVYRETENYEKAMELLRRSLEIYGKTLESDHPDTILSLVEYAELLFREGSYAQAKTRAEEAMVLAVGKEEVRDVIWRVQAAYARTLHEEGNGNAAVLFAKKAVNTIQGLRAGILNMSEDLQHHYVRDKEDIYRFLGSLLIDQGRLVEAQKVLRMLKEEEYFDFIRRDIESPDVRQTVLSFTSVEKPWVRRYEEMASALADADGLEGELGRKRAELREFLDHLGAELAKSNGIRATVTHGKGSVRPYLPKDVLQTLEQDMVLIHYLMADDGLRIILTTSEGVPNRSTSISAKALNRKIFALRQMLQDPSSNPHDAAKDLYDAVIRPIAQDLENAGADALIIYMDGAMRYLPFAALHDGSRYMAEVYDTVLLTEAGRKQFSFRSRGKWRLAGFGVTEPVLGYPPLPAVRSELESIVRTGADDPDGVVPGVIYIDRNFTSDAIVRALEEDYPVLHIASHFVFRPGTESSSYLLLGDGSTLSLARIKNEDYDFSGTQLLSLSACETAMGGAGANGREIEGFGELAQRQGAEAVLATLWPVADEGTGVFMRNMYQYLQERGLTKAKAIRMAQTTFIHSDEYAHPFFWAPFILMGNWQ